MNSIKIVNPMKINDYFNIKCTILIYIYVKIKKNSNRPCRIPPPPMQKNLIILIKINIQKI